MLSSYIDCFRKIRVQAHDNYYALFTSIGNRSKSKSDVDVINSKTLFIKTTLWDYLPTASNHFGSTFARLMYGL